MTSPPRARTQSYRQPPPASWVDWDVPAIRNALREHELGQFATSALLVDWLMRDDRLSNSLGTRARTVQGLPWRMELAPNPSSPGLAEHLGTTAAGLWRRMVPRSVQGQILKWAIMMGFAIAQIVWDTRDGRWIPRLEWWHPQHCWWKWDTRQLIVNTTEGPVEVCPGDGRWFVYAPWGLEFGWMNGAVRTLSLLVLLRQYAGRDWGRASEMYGLGVRVGKIPAGCAVEDRDLFYQQLVNLGTEGVLFLPQGMQDKEGFDFDIKALSGAFTGEVFERLGKRCDMGITLEIQGQNLTSEVHEGSLAAARVHGDVRQDYLEADVLTFGADALDQLLVPWAWYNFGAGPDDLPTPTADIEPPEDKDVASKTLLQVAQSLEIFQRLGLGDSLDLAPLFKRFRLPVRPGVALRLLPPPPPASARSIQLAA